MIRSKAALAVVAPILLLCPAPAGAQPSPPAATPSTGAQAGGPGGELNMFISPAGKPYRGKRGEPYPSATWFAEADVNHDGRLSLQEFRADAEAFFHQLDTNHDGVVDGFEISAYEDAMPEILPRVGNLVAGEGMDTQLGSPGDHREHVQDSPKAGRDTGGRQGAGLFSYLDQPEPVTVADVNFDGRITLQEAQAAADRRFAILDKNGDGFITPDELPKTPVQAMAERLAAQRAKHKGDKTPKP